MNAFPTLSPKPQAIGALVVWAMRFRSAMAMAMAMAMGLDVLPVVGWLERLRLFREDPGGKPLRLDGSVDQP